MNCYIFSPVYLIIKNIRPDVETIFYISFKLYAKADNVIAFCSKRL